MRSRAGANIKYYKVSRFNYTTSPPHSANFCANSARRPERRRLPYPRRLLVPRALIRRQFHQPAHLETLHWSAVTQPDRTAGQQLPGKFNGSPPFGIRYMAFSAIYDIHVIGKKVRDQRVKSAVPTFILRTGMNISSALSILICRLDRALRGVVP